MRTQQPPAAHVSTARRTTSSVPDDSSSQTSPASSSQRSDEIGADDAPLEPLVELRGRRLVGDRQQDPDVGDDALRARLLSTVPAAQLREDQSDLANWTRGDHKARVEQTAERHAGAESVRRAVSEQDEVRRRAGRRHLADAGGVARVYREHRAAGRRDGVTDRRRWATAERGAVARYL